MTNAKLLFTNDAGHLVAEPAAFIRIAWGAAPRSLATTQVLLEQLLLQLPQRRWGRVLVDQRAMLPFSGQEQAWIATSWLPRAVREGGYRHGAVVVM